MLLRRFILIIVSWSMHFAWGEPPPAHAQSAGSDDATVLRAYYSGNGLLQRGMFELAEKEYRDFLSHNQDHEKAPVARYGLAVCMVRLGRYEDALKELDSIPAGAEFPFVVEVQVMQGQCRLALKEYEKAISSLKGVLKRSPDHKLAPDACVQLAEAQYHAGQAQKTVESVGTFLNRWPENPRRVRALFFRGLAHVSMGSDKQALVDLAAVLKAEPEGPLSAQASLLVAQCAHRSGDLEEASRRYEGVLAAKNGSDREGALFGLAVLRMQQQKFAEAAKLFDDYTSAFPHGSDAALAALHRGRSALELGEVDLAIEKLESAIKAGAPADEVAFWIAKCYSRRGEHEKAAETLQKALKSAPEGRLAAEMRYDRAVSLYRGGDLAGASRALAEFADSHGDNALYAEALQLFAVVLHQQSQYEKSLEACRDFLEKFGSHRLADSVAFLSAENLFLSGDLDKASEAYERFLKTNGESADAVKARYRLGMAQFRLGRHDEAAKLLAPICVTAATDPAYRPAFLAMGDILFTRGEWKSAEDYLATYLSGEKSPSSADDARLKLGLARQRQKRYEDAIQAFNDLLAGASKSPHALQAAFERGQCLVALSRQEEARKDFERVLDEGSDSRFAPHALNHLGAIAMARGDADAAAKFFARVSSDGADDAIAGEALLSGAAALMAAKDFDAAQKSYSRFISRFAGHNRIETARANRAICLARMDRFQDAISATKKVDVEKIDPALRSALQYERAWCLKSLGRKDDAAATYRELIATSEKSQPNLHAMIELAALESEAKRFDEAASLLARVRQEATSAGADPALIDQATHRLAVCEFERGRFAEVANLLEPYVKNRAKGPETTSAHALCGEALFKLGRHSAAAEHLYEVVEGDAGSKVCAPALLRLGECLAAMQRWAKSEEIFGRYLKQHEKSESWHQAAFGLAWAIENQGRHTEAIEQYRRVVDRHKGPTAARAQFQIGECLFAGEQYDEAARELLKVDILYEIGRAHV